MKLNKRMLSLLLCILTVLTLLPSAVFASDDVAVFCAGSATDSVVVSASSSAELSVSVAAEGYQWEIYVPAAGVWANILHQTGNTLSVTDAMVNNARNDAGNAKIRCRYLQQGEVYYSRVVSVSVDNSLVAVPDVATSVYTLAAPMMMRSAAPAPEDGVRYTISIQYLFEDGSIASNPYTAVIPENESFAYTVETPEIPGYTAYYNGEISSEIVLDFDAVTEDVSYTIIYMPSDATYTVEHYYQNVDGTYAAPQRDVVTSKTGSLVSDDLAKVTTGFYALPYVRHAVEADGSTVVEIRYNRNYYLVNFDIADGYGTEPVYAPYGASIPAPSDPTRTGYAFNGWSPAVPTVMPAYNTTCVAQWTKADTKYTIVYWHENADDDGYSQYSTETVNAKSGTVVSGKNKTFSGTAHADHRTYFTYERADQNVTVNGDGSTVVNVYYSRNEYTVYFNLKHANQVNGWGSQDSYDKVNIEMRIMVDGVLQTFKESNGDIYSFTAKFDSDISDKWPTSDNFDPKYNFYRWQYSSGNYWLSPQSKMVAALCNTSGYYCYADCKELKETMIAYYMIESFDQSSPAGGSYETQDRRKLYKGTYYDMSVADTRLVACDVTSWSTQKTIFGTSSVTNSSTWEEVNNKAPTPDEVYMYYKRLKYTLTLYTGETQKLATISNVMYGIPMNLVSGVAGYVSGTIPVAPDDLEEGAYDFAGWYTTAEFHEGTEVDLATYTMPNGNTNLYAKWVPVTRTVKTYLTKEALDAGAAPLGTYTATHNTKVGTTVPNPVNGNDFFVGWFYRSGNVDVAFDFGSMPVTSDMSVFAKWSPNPIKTYTVHYQLADGTPVADSTIGEDLVDEVKTFLAKGGEELYADYQLDYYPHTRQCEIKISADNAANSFTFVYSKQEEPIPYTVRYLVKGTETPLRDDKVVNDNKLAVVEEQFEPVAGYIPNYYQQVYPLIPGEENVVIFWYEKDENNVPYRISHYIESVEGGTFTKEYTYLEASAKVGTELTADPMEIEGFTFNSNVEGTLVSGTVTADGAHLKLYYTRNEYPYEIRYYAGDTQLRTAVSSVAKYNSQHTFTAPAISGYTVDGDGSQILTVQIEDGGIAQRNVLTFYYTENTATIKYVVVGPDGSGTVSAEQEEVAMVTGTAQGSTAVPASRTYRFVGWYTDPECTVAVPAAQCNGSTFIPAKNGGCYESRTYYAKFDYNVAELTIRNNNVADSDAAFVYRIQSADNGVDLKVVVYGNGSTTVKDLVSGDYTITEVTGYWRYGVSTARSITLSGQATVITFTSAKENFLWLDDYAHKTNTHIS